MFARFDRLLLVLPGWLAFVLYLPSLSHGFVWDDTYFLVDMPFLRDGDLWWQQIGEPLFVSRNYFRPLPLLSFVAELRLAGLDPFVFHLTNVALHAAITTLVVVMARALLPADGKPAAAAAGLLYAVHPAIVENVCWISDRFDLMMGLFLLLALVCEHRLAKPAVRAIAVALLFFAALLSKETSIVFLALLPLWQAARRAAAGQPEAWRARGDLALWGALALAVGGYLALRYGALGYLYRGDAQMAPGGGLGHLLLIGKTIGWYALLLVFPFGNTLPVHPAVTPVAADDVHAWLGVGAILLAALALARLGRQRERRVPVLLAAAGAVALAPVSNLVPLTIADNLVHDRYLLLPIAFLAIAAATAAHGMSLRCRPALSALAIAWGAAALIAVTATVPRWESNLSLWSWAYAGAPESRLARESYVSALVNAGRNEETAELARKLLAAGDDSAVTTHNLALALARLGRHAEAETWALRAIDLFVARDAKGRMDASEAWNLLGYLRLAQGRGDEAEAALRQAIAFSPFLTRPRYNLALLMYERGQWEEGDRELEFAARYGAPELAAAHARLGARRKAQLRSEETVQSRQTSASSALRSREESTREMLR